MNGDWHLTFVFKKAEIKPMYSYAVRKKVKKRAGVNTSRFSGFKFWKMS